MKENKVGEMSVREASDFWDEHDFFEFKDIEEVTDIKFELKKKKYVGLDLDLYEKIRATARKLHKTSESLIQDWLREKVS
jgi:hypothetical protein